MKYWIKEKDTEQTEVTPPTSSKLGTSSMSVELPDDAIPMGIVTRTVGTGNVMSQKTSVRYLMPMKEQEGGNWNEQIRYRRHGRNKNKRINKCV